MAAIALYSAGRLAAERNDARGREVALDLPAAVPQRSQHRRRQIPPRSLARSNPMTKLACVVISCLAIVACSHKNSGAPGDDSGTGGTLPCGVFGASCTSNDTCCSGMCDPTGACSVNTTTCASAGQPCAANTDCCNVSCIANQCSATQCTSDGATCTQDGQCCSGSCAGGTCAALNTSCKTDGNTCSGDGDCCSKYCNGGVCGPSSWCTQNGDACNQDDQCCGGVCTIGSGASLGTCSQPTVGQTNCSAGVDGTVCDGCESCCSRLCEVYAPTGVKVCQPAEGCRVDGDLCYSDSDCCGGSGTGLPGDGNVQCVKANSNDQVGICRNPQSCNPEGDVCHYQNYQTCGNSSARNDCCGGRQLGRVSARCTRRPALLRPRIRVSVVGPELRLLGRLL